MGTPATVPTPQGLPAGLPAGATVDPTPLQQATTVSAPSVPASQPSPQGLPAGATIDPTPLQQATTVPVSSTASNPNNPLAIDPNASLATKVERGVNDFGAGIGEQFLNSVNSLGNMVGIHSNLLQQRQAELAQNNAQNPTLREGGKLAETGAEFGAGTEAAKAIQGFAAAALSTDGLSGLSTSEQFLKVHKTIKAIEESPLLTRIVTSIARGGIVGAAQGGIENGGTSGAVEGGLFGGAGGAAEEAAPALVKGAKSAASTAADRIGTVLHGNGAIQDTLQTTIRNAINDAAKEAGVPTSNATSIRDVAQDVSDGMIQKAKASYQALDDATGGRYQRFSDSIKNIQQKLRDIAGLDPDAEGGLIEKLATAQDAHDAAMKEAEDAGLPKGLINRANADFRQGKSMLDLNKQIQASAEGIRPEMASAAKRPIAERLSPTKLSPRLDKMINSGRINDAIGPERATAVRAASNDAQADSQTIQSLKAMAKKYAPYAALGIPGMYELIHHLAGE